MTSAGTAPARFTVDLRSVVDRSSADQQLNAWRSRALAAEETASRGRAPSATRSAVDSWRARAVAAEAALRGEPSPAPSRRSAARPTPTPSPPTRGPRAPTTATPEPESATSRHAAAFSALAGLSPLTSAAATPAGDRGGGARRARSPAPAEAAARARPAPPPPAPPPPPRPAAVDPPAAAEDDLPELARRLLAELDLLGADIAAAREANRPRGRPGPRVRRAAAPPSPRARDDGGDAWAALLGGGGGARSALPPPRTDAEPMGLATGLR